MALSGVLAAVALLTSSIPVLLGAMLIAPVYPPLALIAVGLVLRRWRVAERAFGVTLAGLGVAVLCAVITTSFLNTIGIIPEETNLVQRELLEERVRPGWYSVAAALAAGLAGMLGTIRNKTDALIGTIASVALVPAGGAAGIALVSGDQARAIGGMLLLAINVLLIVATGMIVLLAIGRGRRMGAPRHERAPALE
ncbi:MAG: DUF389 domain-containing protein [Acidobacteria bacterium]|nr:DUF389 domain-containing protein [Acidobacteriota bacterium]